MYVSRLRSCGDIGHALRNGPREQVPGIGLVCFFLVMLGEKTWMP